MKRKKKLLYLNRYITIQDGNSGQVYYWNLIQKRRNRTFVKDQSKRRFRERITYRVCLPKYQNQLESLCFSLSLSNFPINQRTPHTDLLSSPIISIPFPLLSSLISLFHCLVPDKIKRKSKMKKKLTPRISFRVRLKKTKNIWRGREVRWGSYRSGEKLRLLF